MGYPGTLIVWTVQTKVPLQLRSLLYVRIGFLFTYEKRLDIVGFVEEDVENL